MYAIVDIAGQQFKVEKNNKVFVHRLENEEGSKVNFDKVLLIDNEGKIVVGEPVIEGACIVAKVVSHCKGDKVLVFKKKRRKGYQVMNGHRQYFTEIEIEDILETGYKPEKKETIKKPAIKKAETKAAEEKKVEAKAEPKTEAKAEKEVVKKEAVKKPAVKKPAAKKAAPKATATKTTAKKAAPKAAAKKTTSKAEPKKTAKKAGNSEE